MHSNTLRKKQLCSFQLSSHSDLWVMCLHISCVCVVPGIEPRGILPPSYTPGPIFLSFILKQGLTKLWRASLCRERERDRERERESWGWLRTRILRSPPPKVLGLQACATTPGSTAYLDHSHFNSTVLYLYSFSTLSQVTSLWF